MRLRTADRRARRVVEFLHDSQVAERTLTDDPQARAALARAAVRMIRDCPELEKPLTAYIRHRAADILLRQPQGSRLSSSQIMEKLRLGIISVEREVPVWKYRWSNATYTSNGLTFNSDAMEMHFGTDVYVPRAPNLLQQALGWAVLRLGWEWLREYLDKYAIDWKERHEPRQFLSDERFYRKVTLGPAKPYYLLLPGELVIANSAEKIGLAMIRRPEFGREPLVGADLSGNTKDARLGLTAHLSAHAIHPEPAARKIIFEVVNLGRWPVKLWLGACFGQLVFYELKGDPLPDWNPNFNGQVTPCGNGHHRNGTGSNGAAH